MLKEIKFTQKDLPKLFEIGKSNYPCVCWIEMESNIAVVGDEEMCNYDNIEKEKLDIFRFIGNGSTIIASKGDLEFGFFGTEEFCKQSFYKISKKISEILTDGKLENNDFMYDGNKYGSSVIADVGDGIWWLGIHISNDINEELIEKICEKQMFKKPAKMPRKITSNEILDLFKEN